MTACPDCGRFGHRGGCESPHCPYCGHRLATGRLVCPECFDLPNLDPMLTRPKVNAKPIGVQPFVKG